MTITEPPTNPDPSTEARDMTGAFPVAAVPDVPYVIGIGRYLGGLHAVPRDHAVWADGQAGDDSPYPHVGAECGLAVIVAREWGEFKRGNEHLSRHGVCPRCAWVVALHHDRGDEELTALAPNAAEDAAFHRLLPDPTLFTRVCRAILDECRQEKGYDADSPRWAQLLGHVTAHRPVVLVSEDCAESGCEHDGEADCFAASSVVACPACSVQAGQWAGEWEGQFEVTVPAPCSVLLALAALWPSSALVDSYREGVR